MIEKHPDWILVDELEDLASLYSGSPIGDTCGGAAKLIRQLKREGNDARDEASRLHHPDTSGQ